METLHDIAINVGHQSTFVATLLILRRVCPRTPFKHDVSERVESMLAARSYSKHRLQTRTPRRLLATAEEVSS